MTPPPADSLSFDGDGEAIVALEERQPFGRYELCYEIGAGGMASVYLARMRGPQGFAKAVAIKRIHPHLTRRDSVISMFLDEAKLASSINHPNVCSVFDFGEVDGNYFLAMEYLVGESLAGLLRLLRSRKDILESERWQRALCHIIADVGQGLHASHELKDDAGNLLGLVHRDVTPHNLFVTFDGAAKLMDFGVAWATQRVTQTTTGAIKGKFAYLAPEQLRQEPFDRRVDVWALGVTLWEGLAGKRLFRRETDVDTLMAIQREEVLPPSSVVPSVPPELDAIVMKALARDRDHRYGTARELTRALRGFLAATPTDMLDVAEVVGELSENKPAKLSVVEEMLTVTTPVSTSGWKGKDAKEGIAVPAHPAALDVSPLPGAPTVVSPNRQDVPPSIRPAPTPTPGPGFQRIEVTDVAPKVAPAPQALTAEALSAKAIQAPSSSRRWPMVFAAAALLGVVATGAFFAGRQSPGTEGTEATEAPPPPQIAESTSTDFSTAALPQEPPESPNPAPANPAEDLDLPTTAPETPSSDPAPVEAAPEPAVQRRRARPRGEGQVNVVVIPGWGEVRHRGRWVQTPTRLTLPAGRHQLRARNPRTGATVTQSVVIRNGETSRAALRIP